MPEPTVRETESVSVSYHGWTTRTMQPLSLRVEGDVVDDRAVSPGTGTGFTGTFDPFTPADHVETERDRTLSVAVVSRDGNGTRIWTSRTLSVNARPRIDEVDVDRSSTYAIGEPIPFAVRAHDPDGGTVDVVWRFGDGTTSSDRAARHAFSEPGSYDVTLTVTDDEGYAVESTVTVTVRNPRPTAEIVRPAGRETYHVGEEIRFEANARDPDGGSVEYRWAFGDDQQAIGQTTPHRYDEPGTYQVVLTVVDDEGGETESRVEVTVRRRGPIETLASLGPSVLVGLGSLLVAVVGLALKLLGGRPSE
jgi:chitodextrinase